MEQSQRIRGYFFGCPWPGCGAEIRIVAPWWEAENISGRCLSCQQRYGMYGFYDKACNEETIMITRKDA